MWTDFNGPFWKVVRENYIHMPPKPDLSDRCLPLFGFRSEEECFTHLRATYGAKLDAIGEENDRICVTLDADPTPRTDEEITTEIRRRLDEYIVDHPELHDAWAARINYRKLRAWIMDQPEIKAWWELEEHLRKMADDSFVGRGLARPGTQIELDNGKRFLIGHINTAGGTGDEWSAFDRSAIVVRYRTLCDPDQE